MVSKRATNRCSAIIGASDDINLELKETFVLRSKSADTEEKHSLSCTKNGNEIILGTAFVKIEILWIKTNHRQVVPRTSHKIAIVEGFENEDAARLGTSTVKNDDNTIQKKLPTCRVAKAKSV